MALSNWDTLAIDQDGKSTNGVFVSPLGVQVEIYKNWLYVHDEKAWEKGGSFVKSTVMEILEGELTYKDIRFIVKRGPQYGVFYIVYVPSWGHKDKKFEAMVGIGVYGFEDEDWVGVTQESLEFLSNLILDDNSPQELKGMDLSQALRFNQGDAYFASHFDKEIPATEVGKANPTILSDIIDNMNKGD